MVLAHIARSNIYDMVLTLMQLLPQELGDPLPQWCGGGKEWQARSYAVRDELEIPPDFHPPVGPLPGLARTPRQVDLIEIATIERQRHGGGVWVADVGQCAGRKPWGRVMPSLHTRSVLYDFSRKKTISTLEMWYSLGLPAEEFPQGTSASGITQAVGEGMSLCSLGTILVSLYLNDLGSWWRQ